MIVDDLSSMQEWLTSVLRPMCDADPEALGKYVLALLKKEIPEEELRRSMSEQLDIFLQEKTQPFIDKLFEHIHTKEYNAMTTSESKPADLDSNDNSPKAASDCEPTDESTTTTSNPSMSTKTSESSDISTEDTQEPGAEKLVIQCNKVEANDTGDEDIEAESNSSMSSEVTASSEVENSDTEPKKAPKSSINDPVKVESNWRSKRSLSCSSDSSHGSHKRSSYASYSRRPLRPHVVRHRQRANWSPLRRRPRRDVGGRRLLRSPLRNRSTSPKKRLVLHKRSSVSKSRSRSQSPLKSKRLASKIEPRAPSPDNDSLLEKINKKCSVKSMIVKPDPRAQPASDEKLRNTRCRDFDEKGLCLRGELCPYDHGSDPFVLEDVVGRSSSSSAIVPNSFGPKPPVSMDKPMVNFMNMFNPLRNPPGSGEYYPENPAIVPSFGWNPHGRPRQQFRPRHLNFDSVPFSGRSGASHPSLMRPYGLHNIPRQLVTIPVDGGLQPSPGPSFGEHPFPGGPWMNRGGVFGMRGRGRGAFDFRRLGMRPGRQMGNCCLEVRKIPMDLNKIEALINHFSRFGNVVSIQTNLDNDPEGALVTFSNQDEASQAYRSTDAVLNNRFIRVFWYCKEKDHNRGNQSHDELSHTSEPFNKPKYLSERPYQHAPSFIPVKDNNPISAETGLDKAAHDESTNVVKDDAVVNNPSAPVNPVIETPKKLTNASYSAELLKTREGMMTLMAAHIDEQKKLIINLETNRDRMTPKQQEDIKKLIGTLQKTCEELKRNIGVLNNNLAQAQTSTSNNNGYPKICSKEEILRKILDAELELYACERNGQETSEVERKILKLRDEETSVVY